MVLAAPRSGTAWAANWLTTDTTLCLHEPLARWRPSELDSIQSHKSVGVACTALALMPEFVNRHPARKVILHRDIEDIYTSMHQLKIPGHYDAAVLDRIEGIHMPWTALFDSPEEIYTFLLLRPFDAERHRELVNFNVQNEKLIKELQRAS